jgi:hypothetical protein
MLGASFSLEDARAKSGKVANPFFLQVLFHIVGIVDIFAKKSGGRKDLVVAF